MQESGYPTFDVSSWFGVIEPKGTPDEVVNKLNATILAALAKPDVQKRLADLGAVPAKTTPAEFGTFIRSEVANWATVVKGSGATVDSAASVNPRWPAAWVSEVGRAAWREN